MRTLVTVSDNYSHLLVPYAILFNKYWPGQDVTFLGFDSSNIPELPDNFNFVSLGKQSDFGRDWTTPLIPYINDMKEEYFMITVEDMILINYVDVEGIKLLENEISSGNAQKAILDTHLNVYAIKYKNGMTQLKQEAPYRTTLQPAIWRKEYFMKYLKPNFTAWDFELRNMKESQRDGATIISNGIPRRMEDIQHPPSEWRENSLFKAVNVYRKGIPFPRWKDEYPWGCATGISKEDILVIYPYLLEGNENKKTILSRIENILQDEKLYR